MTEDFLDAHQRHWDDAERLYAANRLANADHLYGLSAECGLKALSEKFKRSNLGKGERFHVMEDATKKASNAWDIFETYRAGHHLGSKFAMPTLNPFTNWDVSQRYANQSHFNSALVNPHREGAKMVFKFVVVAEKEGIL